MFKINAPVDETPNPPIDAPVTERPADNLLSVAKGGGVAFIGTAVARGLSYVYNLALIRALGADDFGQFALTLAIVTFIGLVSSIGLPQGIIRYGAIRAQTHGKNGVHQVTKSAVRIALIAGLLLMAVVAWAAPDITSGIFHREELTPIFRILALSIPFMSLQSVLLAATRSLKVMKYSTIVWIVQPMIALLLAIPLVLIGLGIMAAAIAYVISFVCGAALALVYYLRLIPPENRN
ncbi:MAG: oligosaccharide flippase family protein, partial [Anaerolineales bacterium]|nr:oligosaccharide flippase family protein [Anaerolineales bacterium]